MWVITGLELLALAVVLAACLFLGMSAATGSVLVLASGAFILIGSVGEFTDSPEWLRYAAVFGAVIALLYIVLDIRSN
jgi:hypothetical protein